MTAQGLSEQENDRLWPMIEAWAALPTGAGKRHILAIVDAIAEARAKTARELLKKYQHEAGDKDGSLRVNCIACGSEWDAPCKPDCPVAAELAKLESE